MCFASFYFHDLVLFNSQGICLVCLKLPLLFGEMEKSQPRKSSFVIHLNSSDNPRCRSVLNFVVQLQVTFRMFPENTAV